MTASAVRRRAAGRRRRAPIQRACPRGSRSWTASASPIACSPRFAARPIGRSSSPTMPAHRSGFPECGSCATPRRASVRSPGSRTALRRREGRSAHRRRLGHALRHRRAAPRPARARRDGDERRGSRRTGTPPQRGAAVRVLRARRARRVSSDCSPRASAAPPRSTTRCPPCRRLGATELAALGDPARLLLSVDTLPTSRRSADDCPTARTPLDAEGAGWQRAFLSGPLSAIFRSSSRARPPRASASRFLPHARPPIVGRPRPRRLRRRARRATGAAGTSGARRRRCAARQPRSARVVHRLDGERARVPQRDTGESSSSIRRAATRCTRATPTSCSCRRRT